MFHPLRVRLEALIKVSHSPSQGRKGMSIIAQLFAMFVVCIGGFSRARFYFSFFLIPTLHTFQTYLYLYM